MKYKPGYSGHFCNTDGSEAKNTSGNIAAANLEQWNGSQASWPSQNAIVQVQVTFHANQGSFGISFQPFNNGSSMGEYFTYQLNLSGDWSFNHYGSAGNLQGSLVSGNVFTEVPNKINLHNTFTLDIKVQGTQYNFYINGIDTTGNASTGDQYSNKIVGLVVEGHADVTFSNFAVYNLS